MCDYYSSQVLRFYGNLSVHVLAGVIKMESYAMKCSTEYIPVIVPFHRSHTAMSMEAMDPDTCVSASSSLFLRIVWSVLLH